MSGSAFRALTNLNPQTLQGSSTTAKTVAVLAGVAFLSMASWVAVPMWPVPITLQSLAVPLIGVLFGWRLGAVTVLAWLGGAALGLPLLAEFKGGPIPFVGPTAGYLAAFPVMAALTGWLAERGWNGARPVLAFASFILANALCLAMGWAWLGSFVGWTAAYQSGVELFILGGVLKSILGAATLAAVERLSER